MRKVVFSIFSALILITLLMQGACAGDIITQDKSKLPVEARTLISNHFPKQKISHIKIDNDFFESKKYKVILNDGTSLEFDSKGRWIEIDCKRSAVPAGLLPEKIRTYVQTNFTGQAFTQIERKRWGYDVELINDISIEFDKSANFIRIDD